MGNYNAQYQSYYNSLAKRQRGGKNTAFDNNKQSRRMNFYMKRLTLQLIGVLVLFIFVLLCKVVVTPKTRYVYNYSKEVINKQYDYGALIDKARDIKFKDIEVITVNFIEKIRNTISDENIINNNVNSEKL
ncbi:endopeptidase [Clostridium sp. CS001]|uniref:endopeptidase n=1 Tax=Clostridium sp. CS001 TaxID=2880648 RepID=UPI001CF14F0E|nr:endopeptidase [Clostridium sp. CS001]MCB2288729.1 endopeptidase [Clostridium sp. CS001]